jgi:hypothetical protein
MAEKKDALGLSEQSITAIAAACHAANAAYCRSLGDDSQPAWSEAPDWQVSSAINGVEFHLSNPAAGDSASHDNWMKAKKADGWKFGETKDPEKKLHPCMVPFDKLPPEQQAKDAIFRSIVHAAAPILAPLDADLSQAYAERDALKRSLAAQKGVVTRAKREAAAVEAERRAGEPRRFAPVEPLTAGELLELVEDADAVELAFVGGGGLEIGGLAPRAIAGEAWKVQGSRLRLQVPDLTVHGPRPGEPPYRLAGYALIADGEVLALTARSDVLAIGPGTTFQLKDDVAF